MYCAKCGKQLKDDANFCDGCGNTIKKSGTSKENYIGYRTLKQAMFSPTFIITMICYFIYAISMVTKLVPIFNMFEDIADEPAFMFLMLPIILTVFLCPFILLSGFVLIFLSLVKFSNTFDLGYKIIRGVYFSFFVVSLPAGILLIISSNGNGLAFLIGFFVLLFSVYFFIMMGQIKMIKKYVTDFSVELTNKSLIVTAMYFVLHVLILMLGGGNEIVELFSEISEEISGVGLILVVHIISVLCSYMFLRLLIEDSKNNYATIASNNAKKNLNSKITWICEYCDEINMSSSIKCKSCGEYKK